MSIKAVISYKDNTKDIIDKKIYTLEDMIQTL